MDNLRREIRVSGHEQFYVLEKFLEEICNELYVADDYYGNILLAVTESVELLMNLRRSEDGGDVRIEFLKSWNGIYFDLQMEIQDLHKGIRKDYLLNNIMNNHLEKELMIIRHLVDEFEFSSDFIGLRLGFSVSGIRLDKSIDRARLLQEFLHKNKVREKVD